MICDKNNKYTQNEWSTQLTNIHITHGWHRMYAIPLEKILPSGRGQNLYESVIGKQIIWIVKHYKYQVNLQSNCESV